MALTTVLVVSTIPFDDRFGLKTAFQTALGQAPQIKDNIGYNNNDLKQAIGTPGANTLVVTLGGLAAAEAADDASVAPYIALTGVDFQISTGSKLRGGRSLATAGHDQDRLDNLLHKHNIQKSKVSLLYNSANAVFSTPEYAQFNHMQPAWIDQNTTQAEAQQIFKHAFDYLPAGIKAVVVSSDAFFTYWSDTLKTVANGYSYRVVYPLKEYKKPPGQVAPKGGQSTIHAPKLALTDAYSEMGSKAKDILSGNSVGWDTTDPDAPEDI